jgi:hypothetical protein
MLANNQTKSRQGKHSLWQKEKSELEIDNKQSGSE